MMWFGGNALRVYQQLTRFMYAFFPSQVLDVYHFLNGASETVYCAKSCMSTWASAFCSNMYLPSEGFYKIRVWNANICAKQSYFLSAHHLEKALSSRNLFSWWAMTDFGIVTLISSYMSMMQTSRNHVIGILVNGEDATHVLKPYMSSICLSRNCTAYAVCSLYYHLTGVPPKKIEEAKVIVLDIDMTEHNRENDEYLFE